MTIIRVSPDWLALREGADAEARATALLDPLRARLGGAEQIVIRDLGCGTGSMGRWLAGRLSGPQHWVLADRDTDLIELAGSRLPTEAADGSPVTVEALAGDVTALTPAELAGTSLVTASALLDLFTEDEVAGIAAACAGARCPALLTLSVTGHVDIEPRDPLDAGIEAAFNAHQRRTTGGRTLLGPDAVDAASAAFRDLGAAVTVLPSPWRLGPDRRALAQEWLRGWVSAACEQDPGLTEAAGDYLRRRLDQDLRVTVGHSDLLAMPDGAPC